MIAHSEQFDALLDFPVQTASAALRDTHGRLEAMRQWDVAGSFAHGVISFNPGFSIVAIDPHGTSGFAVDEFHGFRNDSIDTRMHVRLARSPGWTPTEAAAAAAAAATENDNRAQPRARARRRLVRTDLGEPPRG